MTDPTTRNVPPIEPRNMAIAIPHVSPTYSVSKILFGARNTMFDFEVFRPESIARTLKPYSVFESKLLLSIWSITFEKGGTFSIEVLVLIISCVILLTFEEGL